MKLFKKALVATAIIGSFAAQAVTIAPSTKLELSAEGVQYGVAATAAPLSFDIVVEKDHPATTEITLTFDKNVDLNGIAGGACTPGTVPGSGTADQCGDILFNYGNGNFTFDNVVVTEATKAGEVDVITFTVSTGNAITAFSSFGITLDGSTDPKVSGATAISYESVYNTAVVESGVFDLATEKSQFTFALVTPLNGVVERDAQTTFVNGSGADTLAYTLVNDESLTLLIPDAEVDVVVEGDFEDVDMFATTTGAVSTPLASMSTGSTELDTLTSSYNYTSGTTKVTHKELWTFTGPMNSPAVIPQTGATKLKAVVVNSSDTVVVGNLPTGGHSIAADVASGEWLLDATIINVPYFPVNYADTQSSVHIANEGSTDADVIVTAIDNMGVEHGPSNLGFAANANTVTKVSQSVIATLFNINDATKLSVTFNIDADEDDVSAYAVTQNTKGRSEVSNSQSKGK